VDRIVGVGDGVELLVTVLNSEKNLGRIRLVGRRNLHGLEAPLEGTVFFDRLAIFPRSGCSNALNLAARKSRLEDVGCVKRTFCRSGAHQSMQLVNEDDAVLRLHQFLHDGLEALFELTAVLGSSDDQREIKSKDSLIR